jgi:hypothetical protein
MIFFIYNSMPELVSKTRWLIGRNFAEGGEAGTAPVGNLDKTGAVRGKIGSHPR